MNADKYISVINENLEKATVKMNLEEKFVFQQDNDPKHVTKEIMKFFNDSDVKLFESAQSPDLKPIENLWYRIPNFFWTRKRIKWTFLII